MKGVLGSNDGRPARRRLWLGGALLVCAVGCMAVPASAQSSAAPAYPTKPIRLIVPFAPGATTDFLARVLAQNGNAAWGQPVVVDNRPGAGGQVGTELLARAAPDGYTMGVITGSLSMYPAIIAKLTFDPVGDFDFVSLIARVPNVLVVNQAHPAKTFAEFAANLKAEPGQSYASSGAGTNTHFTGELLRLESGLDLQHVSYRGGAPAMADLVAGHVRIMMASLTTAVPHIKSGKIRPLAVSSAGRSPALPDTPTLKELGFPSFDNAEWWAIIAPRGTPPAALALWKTEVEKVVADPVVAEKSPGIELVASSSAELQSLVVREVESWKSVVERAKIKME